MSENRSILSTSVRSGAQVPFLRGADPVGVRLINCTESRVTLARLEMGLGLGVFDAAIGRTELIVEAARRERDRARSEVDQALVTAFFMTVWHRRSRSAESSCGIRPD